MKPSEHDLTLQDIISQNDTDALKNFLLENDLATYTTLPKTIEEIFNLLHISPEDTGMKEKLKSNPTIENLIAYIQTQQKTKRQVIAHTEKGTGLEDSRLGIATESDLLKDLILPSDALVGNIQDLSPYLQEVAHRINDKYEKRVDAKLKIAPNRLDAIRSELRADGYLKDAGSLTLVNRMILAHQNHIDQVFHAKKISKLKKSIVANWDIERMNITQREYLAFVLKSIKTWFDKHTKMREAGKLFDQSKLNIDSISKIEGVNPSHVSSLIGILSSMKESKDELENFLINHQEEVHEIADIVLRKGQKILGKNTLNFFSALSSLLGPEDTLYLHLRKGTYPHMIPTDFERIISMITKTGRINYPSGVLAVTGNFTASTTSEEAGPMNRYRGILEAYIQTADRLLSDARKEVKTFEKIISSENLKLTPSMASYIDGYLLSHEYVVKKNLTRQEAFVDACLQPGGLVDRLFNGFNKDRISPQDVRIAKLRDNSQRNIAEVVRATSWFTKIVVDLLRIYKEGVDQLQGENTPEQVKKFIQQEKEKYQNKLNSMMENSLEQSASQVLESKKNLSSQRKVVEEVFSGYMTIYSITENILNKYKSLLKEGKNNQVIIEELRQQYKSDSLYAPTITLLSMMQAVDGGKRYDTFEAFFNIFGGENPLVLSAAIYQSYLAQGDQEGQLSDLFEKRYKLSKDDSSLMMNAISNLEVLLGKEFSTSLYKAFTIFLIERGEHGCDPQGIITNYDGSNYDTHESLPLTMIPISLANKKTTVDSFLDREGDVSTIVVLKNLLSQASSNADFILHDFMLDGTTNELLKDCIYKLYEEGHGERVLDALLAKNEDDLYPDYQEDLRQLCYDIKQILAATGVIPSKYLTSTRTKYVLDDKFVEKDIYLGLAGGPAEEATEEDIAAIRELEDILGADTGVQEFLSDTLSKEFLEEDLLLDEEDTHDEDVKDDEESEDDEDDENEND